MVINIILLILLLTGCSAKDWNQENDDNIDDSSTEILNNINDDNKITTVKWAFPANSLDNYEEPIENIVNVKLEEDGYDFRLECVYIDNENYNEEVKNCNSDIVWTGIRNRDNIKQLSPAYLAIKEDKYMCLDSFLDGSKLYELYPESLWDSVKIGEKIFCIPNTVFPDCGLALAFSKDKYSKAEIDDFDDTLESLLKLLGESNVLGYSGVGCEYLDMYNIPNELAFIYFEDGKIKNLMENELNINWIRTLNSLAKKGQLVKPDVVPVIENNEVPQWDIALLNTGEVLNLDDNKYWKIYYKGDSGDNFKASTAIKADSANPEKAFKMIELFMTDSEYGNLLVYGRDVFDQKGYAVNPQSGRKVYAFNKKMYLGINDGVLKGEADYYSFSTPEERRDYYDEYIRQGNLLWMEYPELAGELYYMIDKYDKMIWNKKNFEEELEKCIEDSKRAFALLN